MKGFLKAGDHVVATSMRHKSIGRPIRPTERENGVKVTFVRCSSEGLVDLRDLEQAIGPNTRLIILKHASYVTGTLTALLDVIGIAKDRGVCTFRFVLCPNGSQDHWYSESRGNSSIWLGTL
jgi:cysteine desulfurase/selenocysteine lyase